MAQGTEADRGFLAASRRTLESRQKRKRILHALLYVVLTAISLMALVPIFYMMSTSLKAHGMEYEWPMRWTRSYPVAARSASRSATKSVIRTEP